MQKFKLPSQETLRRRNSRFAKLSKPEQRVAICKDMLKAIASGLQIPLHNDYQGGKLYKAAMKKAESVKTHQVIDQSLACTVECKCCQLGGMLLAAHRQGNGDPSWMGVVREKLRKYWTERQLSMMERAFEGWSDPQVSVTYFAKNRGLSSPKNIQIAICKNVIRNKGTFVPSDMTGYKS